MIEERPQEPELRLILDVVARVAEEWEESVFGICWTRRAVVQGQWSNPNCAGAALLCVRLILMAPDGKEANFRPGRSPRFVVEREWADAQHAKCAFLGLMILEIAPQRDDDISRFRRRVLMPPDRKQVLGCADRRLLMGEPGQRSNADQ